jgi:hypothetical protein
MMAGEAETHSRLKINIFAFIWVSIKACSINTKESSSATEIPQDLAGI